MYKFKNFPEKIWENIYYSQQSHFISFLSEDKNIISIYSVWELGLLWVSDLDYLIIYKNDLDRSKIRNFTKQYKLIDTILFLDIDDISNKSYVSHHILYNLVFWKDLNLSFDKSNKNLNIIYTWKICFFSLLRNFYFYKFNKKILVKNLLSQLNDLRYPIYFLKILWINSPEYDDFIEEYTIYRSNYFKHNNYKELERFLKQAIKISWNIIFDLNDFLQKKDQNYNIYWRFPTKFKQFNKKKYYIENTEHKLEKIWKFSRFLCLPLWFNYNNWEWTLRSDLNKIIKNNNNFLNFGFNWF